ncbi:RNA polymerase sigma factor [Glaciecola sp. SC05]|uniref:RNA polymerase sigma factor n=1 Tax=Glaciecola sp. SC05 TaxID=1987355 RepID=UPI0035274D1D
MNEFEHIIKEYGPLLSRVASTYEANESLKQELFQEICVAVWQSLQRFKGDASIKTYILRVAHNRCITHVSKQINSIKTVDWQESEQSPAHEVYMSNSQIKVEHEVAQMQQLTKLLSLIRQLKLPARQVISLSLEGLSYHEIAEVSGLSANNVGVMIKRIKSDLNRQMHYEQ